jgi:hypothetical protein
MAAVSVGHAQSTVPPNERGLWKIWETSTNAVDATATVVTACQDFRAKSPRDPLGVVVAGLEAWHLLRTGNTNAAVALFESMMSVPEPATALQAAGAEMARSWLTRLDREKVRLALKTIYAKEIAFPVTLEPVKTLKGPRRPPLQDRWGRSWEYRRESAIQGLSAQQYILESTQLGSRSDLAQALALPYAGGISLAPVRRLPASADTIEFVTLAGKSAVLQAGGTQEGTTIAYVGQNLLVMADGNHWRVVLSPR